MNNIVTAIAFLLLTGTAPVLAQDDVKEQLVIPLSDPGKPGSIEIGLINGFIHVVGYTGKDVVIDAVSDGQRRERSTSRAAEPGMRRIPTGNGLELSAEERNNRIKVNTSSHSKPVNLTIKVPQRFSLKLSTVNTGDIIVENVNGELEINNVNGPIELTNISGSAVANTVNGDLRAVFREVDSKTPMAFSTLNGRVDVTFPSNAKANVKMKSDRGDIFSDFDIDIEKAQPKATRSSQSGMYRVSVEDWVYGKINGGGPEIMMKSMQGSIFVRKAK
ncbi:hypothetical protein DYU11_32640 [Fibrisoma montanum]|uniref:DUF4097 domain-containing protein n=1 Tax=Fibrisoma montanum TaxID=2305895 RepID=A0A418LVJ1_9BACT|nr:DUF4097 family beta strand repeat-containing protein [Fibrisoma montanum]RIV17258.1 hypothetical protein DYU11_32640 [Fibrisoma montanum]